MPETLMKDTHLTIRTTPARKERYRATAAQDGLRLSEWIRQLADYRVHERELREALR